MADEQTVFPRPPIIILGAPRSGTTVLGKLFEAHRDVHLETEPRLLWRFRNDQRSDQLRPEHLTSAIREHIRSQLAARLAASGRLQLVEKTPSNCLRPAFVHAVLPEAVFVHVIRSGWDSVAGIRAFWERTGTGFTANQKQNVRRRLAEAGPSQLPHYAVEFARRLIGASAAQPQGPRVAGLREMLRDLGLLEASAIQWSSCVASAATFGRALGEQYHEVRFEALSESSFSGLLDALHLQYEALQGGFGDVFDNERPTRRSLDDDERRRVAPYVVPTEAWLRARPS